MIENEVTSLKDMSVNELKELWRQYFCSSTFLFNNCFASPIALNISVMINEGAIVPILNASSLNPYPQQVCYYWLNCF